MSPIRVPPQPSLPELHDDPEPVDPDDLPGRRLGHVLRQARRQRGLTREQAALAGGRFTASELHGFETGRVTPTDAQLTVLAAIYRPDGTPLVPTRLRLAVLPPERLHRDSDARMARSSREVLLRYLAVVYHLRRVPAGRRIDLRAADLAVLAGFVDSDVDEVAATMIGLMHADWSEIERYRFEVQTRPFDRRLNITIATTTRGALILTRRRHPVG